MAKKSSKGSAKMSVLEPGHSRPGIQIERRTQNTRGVPSTGPAYLQAAIQLLLIEPDSLALRSLEMCDEAATVLVEEAEAMEASAPAAAQAAAPAAEADDGFSPREEDTAEVAATSSATTRHEHGPYAKRLEATYLLMAAAVCGASAQGVQGVAEYALKLARRALTLSQVPMTQVTLAMVCYNMRHTLPFFQSSTDKKAESLPTIVVDLARHAAHSLSKATALLQEEQCYYARALWLLALMGHVDDVAVHLNHLTSASPTNYLALLLSAMLHTTAGNTDAALVAALHVEAQYTDDPCAASLIALLRQAQRQPHVLNAGSSDPEDVAAGIDEELGVALARTVAFAETVNSLDELTNRKKALKALCVHCAPGEESASTLHLSATELKRRAAGHWLLLAHVAIRAGAFHVAALAVESSLTYLATQNRCHSFVYAAALTNYAMLVLARRLDHAGAQFNGATMRLLHAVVRPLKAQARRQAPPQRTSFGATSLNTEVSAGTSPAGTTATSAADDTSSTWRNNALFAQNCLEKAVQLAPYYSEAHIGLGTLKVLAASQPELSIDDRTTKLVEASDAFARAVQCAPTRPAAYMGMGCALEAQGMMEESLEFYVAAAELSAQEPLIPFDYFAYMFE